MDGRKQEAATLAALGRELGRLEESRIDALVLVRSLEAGGYTMEAKALRASMMLSYGADDVSAVAVRLINQARRVWAWVAALCALSALVGGLAGAAVVLLQQV